MQSHSRRGALRAGRLAAATVPALAAVALATAVVGSVYAVAASQQNVQIVNGGGSCAGLFCFAPPTVTGAAGDSVLWTNGSAAGHTITRCTPAACSGAGGGTGNPTDTFGSSTVSPGGTFSHTFTAAGTYIYYCAIHGYTAMHGLVTITSPPPTPTPTPLPTPTPRPTPPPTPTPTHTPLAMPSRTPAMAPGTVPSARPTTPPSVPPSPSPSATPALDTASPSPLALTVPSDSPSSSPGTTPAALSTVGANAARPGSAAPLLVILAVLLSAVAAGGGYLLRRRRRSPSP